MGILVIVGVLFGMIFGQFFKCFVLFPACGLAIVLVLASPAHMDTSLLGSFLQFIVLTTSIQIGYVVGFVTCDFQYAPKELTKNFGVRTLDETSSGGSESREPGKRAA